MRVLVTGHNVYIGTVLVPMLITEGHYVVGLDSNLYERCTFGDGFTEVREIRKDIRDIQSGDLEGFDAVIHLAALSNDPLGNLNPQLTYEINHQASVKLAKLAKKVGVSIYVADNEENPFIHGDDRTRFLNRAKLPLTSREHGTMIISPAFP